jgi:hypothetical protein
VRLRQVLVALILAGCASTSGQSSQVAQMDSCVTQDQAYASMRRQAHNAMAEQGLDLPEVLTGFEASARLLATPGGSMSSEDSRFLTRYRFIGLYGGTPFTLSRFEALRACMEQSYGVKIRVIEIRPPGAW